MPLTLIRHALQKPEPGPLKLNPGNILGNGMICAWLLNDPGNTAFDPLTGVASAFIGGTTWTSGGYGPMLNFNGTTGGVQSTKDLDSTSLTRYSVLALARSSSVAAGTANIFAAGQNPSGTADYCIQLRRDTADWNLYQFTGVDTNANMAGGVTVNTWTWVGGTWDGSNIRLYVNGVVQATTAATSIQQTGNCLSFGYDGCDQAVLGVGGGQFWAGDIALVYFWKRALSTNEMLTVQTEPYSMWQTRPIQRWLNFGGHPVIQMMTAADQCGAGAAY